MLLPRHTYFKFGAALLAAALVTGSFGCELITAVDREKIPSGGGTGGTGGSGASGGTGGAPECSVDPDCPDPGNECLTRSCNAGKCENTPVADGTPVGMQTAGDCKSTQCDGAG